MELLTGQELPHFIQKMHEITFLKNVRIGRHFIKKYPIQNNSMKIFLK